MLKILALLVFSVSIYAQVIPIRESVDFVIPTKKTINFEFPFKISVISSPFYSSEKIEKEIEEPQIVTPNINGEIRIKNKKNIVQKPTAHSFTFKSSDNIISIFAKKEGTTELTVWGYDEHPILLNIIVSDDDTSAEGDRFFKFEDYKVKVEEAKKFESNPHERVLEKLLKALYSDETPKGYKVQYESSTYTKGGLRHKLEKSLIGNQYLGEVWSVENTDSSNVILYEELYASDKIYLVSIEANELEANEISRVFIVREK